MPPVWFSRLKTGQVVYIRKPWFDGVHPGGELHKAVVSEVFKSGLILVNGHGVFYPASQTANFNTRLERPSKAIASEYEAQQKRGKIRKGGYKSRREYYRNTHRKNTNDR